MGAIKQVLNQAAVIIMVIAACYFMLYNVQKIHVLQQSLQKNLTNKGVEQIEEGYPELYVEGKEIVALFLLPEGIQEVRIEDSIVSSSKIKEIIPYIELEKQYKVIRKQGKEGSGVYLQIDAIPE